MVALLDVTALAAAFGVAFDKDDKEQAKQRKKDEAKKKALVVALHTKALALADLHALDAAAHPLAALDAAVAALHKWAAEAHTEHAFSQLHGIQSTHGSVRCVWYRWAAHSEHVKLTCRWHKAHGRSATALSVLNETLGKEKRPLSPLTSHPAPLTSLLSPPSSHLSPSPLTLTSHPGSSPSPHLSPSPLTLTSHPGKEKKPPSKENLELKTELYDALGWSHWASLGKAVLHVKFPPGFPLVYKAL